MPLLVGHLVLIVVPEQPCVRCLIMAVGTEWRKCFREVPLCNTFQILVFKIPIIGILIQKFHYPLHIIVKSFHRIFSISAVQFFQTVLPHFLITE